MNTTNNAGGHATFFHNQLTWYNERLLGFRLLQRTLTQFAIEQEMIVLADKWLLNLSKNSALDHQSH